MLERRVEVDVVGDRRTAGACVASASARAGRRARAPRRSPRSTPAGPSAMQRVQRRLREDVAEPATGRRPRRRPASRRRGAPPREKTPKPAHERQRYTAARAGLRAVGACEPRQIRKEAALSIPSQVCGSARPLGSAVSRARPARRSRARRDRPRVRAADAVGRLRTERALRGDALVRRRPSVHRPVRAARRATSCAATATTTRRRGRRSTSGRRRGTSLLRAAHLVPPNPNAGQPLSRPRWSACRFAASGRSASGRSCCPALLLLLLVRGPPTASSRDSASRSRSCSGSGRSCCRSRRCSSRTCRRRCSRSRRSRSSSADGRARSLAAGACAGLAVATDLPLARRGRRCSGSTPRRRAAPRRLAAFAAEASSGCCRSRLRHLGVRHAVPPRVLGRRDRPRRRRRRAGARARPLLHPHVAAPAFRGRAAPEPARAARALAGARRRRGRRRAALATRPARGGGARSARSASSRSPGTRSARPTTLALGGWVPGPRFLMPLLPFLCFALAPVVRRAPGDRRRPRARLGRRDGRSRRAPSRCSRTTTRTTGSRASRTGTSRRRSLSLAGIGHGWLAILPFYALVARRGRRRDRSDAAAGRAARPRARRRRVVAWVVVEHGAPALLAGRPPRARGLRRRRGRLLLVAAPPGRSLLRTGEASRRLPAAALAFATRRFDEHTKWAPVSLVVVVLALMAGRAGSRLAGLRPA